MKKVAAWLFVFIGALLICLISAAVLYGKNPNLIRRAFPLIPVSFVLEKEIEISKNESCQAYFEKVEKEFGTRYKGDFLANMNVSNETFRACIGYDTLSPRSHTYFVSRYRKISKLKEVIFERIVLSKWPSAIVDFEAVADSNIRIYRIDIERMNWPKGEFSPP